MHGYQSQLIFQQVNLLENLKGSYFYAKNLQKGAEMNPGTVIDVSILVSVSSLLIAAATFFSNRKKDIQQDSQGVLKANMKQIGRAHV